MLIILIPLYYTIATLLFIYKRNSPAIRVRSPMIVLVTPIGQFVDAILLLLVYILLTQDIS